MHAIEVMILSGGQTGVDRAALDFALANGFKCGGYCPAGRMAEDGKIPARYPLNELSSPTPAVRTQWNIMHSQATMVLYIKNYDFGTASTMNLCRVLKKPFLEINLYGEHNQDEIIQWLKDHKVYRLNIAGPRESFSPGIGIMATDFFKRIFLKKDL